jgi:preprotein translocase subunit SecY
MLEKLRTIFMVPELRRRILFTLSLFVVYRLGEHMPTPGVNAAALAGAFQSQANTLFGLYDMFVGGAFSRATVFALGIMPYISASIILQLLGAVVPYFEKLRKEGEEGQKKITQWTRYGTVLISIVQSYAYSIFLVNLGASQGLTVVPDPGFSFYFSTIVTQTAGTILVMWLGEKITEFGIGNGISLIIFVNILGGVPTRVMQAIEGFRAGNLGLIQSLIILALMVAVIAAVIVMTQATRKIPVQYAKRMVGRKMYGGQSTHIPLAGEHRGRDPDHLRLEHHDPAHHGRGVLPARPPGGGDRDVVQPDGIPVQRVVRHHHRVLHLLLHRGRAQPERPGGEHAQVRRLHPGHPAGPPHRAVHRQGAVPHHAPGAFFLAGVAVLPDVIIATFHVPAVGFGGTSVLIVVGVALDTLQQIESHLLMRHYEGFVKRGRIRGRSRM